MVNAQHVLHVDFTGSVQPKQCAQKRPKTPSFHLIYMWTLH